jgi:hypothetical protein
MPSLTEGQYVVTVETQDHLLNPVVVATPAAVAVGGVSVDYVVLDRASQGSVFTSPVTPTTTTAAGLQVASIEYTLNEAPQANSVLMAFRCVSTCAPVGVDYRLLLADSAKGVVVKQDVNVASIVVASLPAVRATQRSDTSAAFTTIPDGTYSVILQYTDIGNHVSQVTKTGILLDSVTIAPLLLEPTTTSTYGRYMSVNYILPEEPSPTGTDVSLKFTRTTTPFDAITLQLDQVRSIKTY